jgi:hypothetical protein
LFGRRSIIRGSWKETYNSPPPYQQNDYIGLITRSTLKQTQEKRLAQMLDELARGDRYMKMDYRPKKLL